MSNSTPSANIIVEYSDIGYKSSLVYDQALPIETYRVVGRTSSDALTNKTLSSTTNNIAANALMVSGTPYNIDGSATDGQVLGVSSGALQFITVSSGTFYTTANNTAIGLSTPLSSVGTDNTWLGWSAGTGATSGARNLLAGKSATYGAAGSDHTIIGAGAFSSTGVTGNTLIGSTANATSIRNVVLGQLAGVSNGTGGNHVVIGYNATNASAATLASNANVTIGASVTNDGSATVAIGRGIIIASTVTNGVCIGNSAALNGGANNTVVGQSASCGGSSDGNVVMGRNASAGGDNSIVIGLNASASTDDSIAIGTGASTDVNGCLAIGSAANPINTSISATLGAAGALPAQVLGYLTVRLNGANVKIPYYNV